MKINERFKYKESVLIGKGFRLKKNLVTKYS